MDALEKVGRLSEVATARLFRQILSSTEHLHTKCICHRDLKPEKFMVATTSVLEDAMLKMADFITAKRFDLAPMMTKVFTDNYVAPEVLKRDMAYTEKADI